MNISKGFMVDYCDMREWRRFWRCWIRMLTFDGDHAAPLWIHVSNLYSTSGLDSNAFFRYMWLGGARCATRQLAITGCLCIVSTTRDIYFQNDVELAVHAWYYEVFFTIWDGNVCLSFACLSSNFVLEVGALDLVVLTGGYAFTDRLPFDWKSWCSWWRKMTPQCYFSGYVIYKCLTWLGVGMSIPYLLCLKCCVTAGLTHLVEIL